MNNGSEKKKSGSESSEILTAGAGQSSSGIMTPLGVSAQATGKPLPKLYHISEILDNVLGNIYNRGEEPRYPIGLRELDEKLWGLHKKELLVIGGRTSLGKSSLALQMAVYLADNHNRVGYFSLEMSKEQLVERIISLIYGINNLSLRKGLAKEQVKKHEAVLREYLPSMKLLIDDEHGYDFDKIVTICEELKFDFVFMDYIQMVSVRKFKSKIEAIDEYVRKFKELCKTLNMGGVLVSQINREGEGSPSLSTLKGSGTLEEHPDAVILIDWDKKNDIYKIKIEKQRHGECGEVLVDFVKENFRFRDYMPRVRRRTGVDDIR
jgi:replicative DNA helicase